LCIIPPMKITIEDQTFDTAMITQLYPAAIVMTGHGDETTQMSLEWLDTESKGVVEVAGYGIFLHLGEEKHSFVYESREELEEAIGRLAAQLRG